VERVLKNDEKAGPRKGAHPDEREAVLKKDDYLKE
jgi:hypothetical protein